MADNIRPALYGARYTVLLANRTSHAETMPTTVVGRYCETGDILARDVPLPMDIEAGDLLVFPVAGAYAIPMSSQYNGVPRPAVALVREDGTHQLLRRRETYDDLLRHDLPLDEISRDARWNRGKERCPYDHRTTKRRGASLALR